MNELTDEVRDSSQGRVGELERRVAGRFKVIWSVFRAHSSAEDEFIWPALRMKTQGRVGGADRSPKHDTFQVSTASFKSEDDGVLEQDQYIEDHADEERMFKEMDRLLTKLREVLVQDSSKSAKPESISQDISQLTRKLSQHLMAHLEKEETQCMPLVVKHLSKEEIHELVGNIMGKRSADTIAQIMTMAVQNLDVKDREEMVKIMKQSMAGTYFDRWLVMSGWMSSSNEGAQVEDDRKRSASTSNIVEDDDSTTKRLRSDSLVGKAVQAASVHEPSEVELGAERSVETTSQAELQKLIRAIVSNSALSPEQKNTTIQGLRDSVWRSNVRAKELDRQQKPTIVNASVVPAPFTSRSLLSGADQSFAASTATTRTRRVTPPSMYFMTTPEGKIVKVWTDTVTTRLPEDGPVPLFSAAELAPTYHDGAAASVLGCPHYAQACKLRHPKSGRLYTCRLCCQQERELPMRDQDEPLDRYEVTEVMCMTCLALQPSGDRCLNEHCERKGKPFAKYFCRICHLYDDSSRSIFHCPYCNICRLGLGLGIDFRHCMRCNACVSLADDEEHQCIPQKLQGDCPICHEELFQSTEPLRGLKCGHVMHLSCFTAYRRGHKYTCPLCMKSMEDMSEYFALLDSAVRMQPMPQAYLSTMSSIYCQDCGKTGQVAYHFVGQKCSHCGSYNTREMGRVQAGQSGRAST